MYIFILEQESGKLRYSSLTRDQSPSTSALIEIIYQNILNNRNSTKIALKEQNYHFIFKKFNTLIIILCQISTPFSNLKENQLKDEYLDKIFEILKKKSLNVMDLTYPEIENIIWRKIFKSPIQVNIISGDISKRDNIVKSIFGIEFTTSNYIMDYTPESHTIILWKGSGFFESNAEYIEIIWQNYDYGLRFLPRNIIKNNFLAMKNFIIVLVHDLKEGLNYHQKLLIDQLETSKNVKKVLILIDSNNLEHIDKIKDCYHTIPIEIYSFLKFNAKYLTKILNEHFESDFNLEKGERDLEKQNPWCKLNSKSESFTIKYRVSNLSKMPQNLTKLKILDLSGLNLKNLVGMTSPLPKLTSLKLQRNQLRNLAPFPLTKSTLKFLDLSFNSLGSEKALLSPSIAENLDHLILTNNHIKSWKALQKSMPNLTKLEIQWNCLENFQDFPSDLPKLKSLNFSFNKIPNFDQFPTELFDKCLIYFVGNPINSFHGLSKKNFEKLISRGRQYLKYVLGIDKYAGASGYFLECLLSPYPLKIFHNIFNLLNTQSREEIHQIVWEATIEELNDFYKESPLVLLKLLIDNSRDLTELELERIIYEGGKPALQILDSLPNEQKRKYSSVYVKIETQHQKSQNFISKYHCKGSKNNIEWLD